MVNKKMAGKKIKTRKTKPQKSSKKTVKQAGASRKHVEKPAHNLAPKNVSLPIIQTASIRQQAVPVLTSNRTFSISLGTISGDTSIGDLIVAFPRTREVLMKHGLRFDVEEAGYLYMTLNVFSAIHGLATNNLVQELHTASKEPPPPIAQPLRPTPTAPTA